MEGYILIVLQILITGLIIWRRKQDSKEPSGICSGIPVRRWTFQHCMANRHGTNHVWNRRCKD